MSQRSILLSLLGLMALPMHNAVADVFRGQTPSGANYLIETPTNWQPGRGLVIFNRGFQLDMPEGDPSLGPDVLKARMLAQGYALAASNYSLGGWATFGTKTDLKEL
jgi:hypothetical protein